MMPVSDFKGADPFRIRIATRESQLALWQANEVARLLKKNHPDLEIDIIGMTTEGDRFLQASLATAGGKGLFVKELEHCLLSGSADIAVHSMKDVPYELPDSLGIHAILEREDPRDAFISTRFNDFSELPANAIVGTSSTRRACQLNAARDDLDIQPLRGNVNTRLAKLDAKQYDAIILASAGLKRLGFGNRITSYLDTDISLPAIGQGAIGIECRNQDSQTKSILRALHHQSTTRCVTAERNISKALSANCHLPIAAFATENDGLLKLCALVGTVDGSQIIRTQAEGNLDDLDTISSQVIEDLNQRGAAQLIASASA